MVVALLRLVVCVKNVETRLEVRHLVGLGDRSGRLGQPMEGEFYNAWSTDGSVPSEGSMAVTSVKTLSGEPGE